MSDTRSSSEHKNGLSSTRSVVSEEDVHVDPAMEKRVWRKLDIYVLPIVAMFYLLSFLDRTNVANARVAGLQKDLKMSNKEYSIALTVTYVPYIVAELPSNLMLKAVGPNLMLPTMLTLWGVVTTLQGVVKSYSGLLAARFFLGLLEGGVFPGLVLYLSYFYPRYKMNLRVAAFFASASLSGAFSGILAYGIIHMDGIGGRPGWSWIFILEGLFTVVFGASSYFTLPRAPEKCWFLNEEEKKYVAAKLHQDNVHKEEQHFTWREVGEAFKLPQVWFLAFTFFMAGVILYSLAYFSPSIVQSLGYTAARAQLMSVPPFAVAFVLSMACAFISDKFQCRGIISIFSSILCVIGFSMFLGSKNTHVQYGSLFLSIPGTYTAAPTLSAWGSNNASPQTRRATAIAISFIMTNSGGILATWLLGSLSAAPRYTSATIALLVFSVCQALGAAANLAYLTSQNRKKAEVRRTMSKAEEKPGLGDRSAWFIYNT
ncbi:mfs transporter [Moniliophthora roreri MCA 2997]|uniref:Mfs transporter n=2 Tax=Moniliophthora roreri TaxID=221103 RepID=V2XYS2_MONRO|nr:mfs transporter [Moniliophthora roreri MCA 2997]KAI3616641.1 mfs transporter [Moniliophthora roreri]